AQRAMGHAALNAFDRGAHVDDPQRGVRVDGDAVERGEPIDVAVVPADRHHDGGDLAEAAEFVFYAVAAHRIDQPDAPGVGEGGGGAFHELAGLGLPGEAAV